MADQRYPLELPVGGMLDTSGPISNRPPGTLVEAWDLASDAWGPRRGSQAFTRVWESPGTGTLYDYVTFLSGAYASCDSYEDKFKDLGTKFTLDIIFRLEAWAYATGNDRVGLYGLTSGIQISLLGDTQGANEGKIEVKITTSAVRGTPDAAVTFVCDTAISSGTALTDVHHLRVVRNGSTCTAYLDGVQDGQTTSLSATATINQAFGSYGLAYVAFHPSADIEFYGKVFLAVLRDGAYSSAPITSDFPCAPWASNVHHYFIGRVIDQGGSTDFLFDCSSHANHPRVIGTITTQYTVTSSNWNDYPIPAITQGLTTWTTRTNKTATSVMAGGVMSTSIVS